VKRRMLVVALSAFLALALATPVAFGQPEQQAGESPAYGKTGKLAGAWLQWALSKPIPKNPMLGEYRGGPKCNGRPVSETPGEEKWWFLAGTFGGQPPGVERTCAMPAGRWLFFPVANYLFIITEPGETEELGREQANEFMKSVLTDPDLSISVTVDGEEVLRRADSPLVSVRVPENNVFDLLFPGAVEGGSYEGLTDGLWATMPPLSKGKHTVHFELSAPNVDLNPDEPGAEGFFQENTYHLTVKRAKPDS
jgi:hypothetical protein